MEFIDRLCGIPVWIAASHKMGHKSSLCLRRVSRKNAFSESRMAIGDYRAFNILHRKVAGLERLFCPAYLPLVRLRMMSTSRWR